MAFGPKDVEKITREVRTSVLNKLERKAERGDTDAAMAAERLRKLIGGNAYDSHVTDSRRARLHRALDCVLDRSAAARDARTTTCPVCTKTVKVDEWDSLLRHTDQSTGEKCKGSGKYSTYRIKGKLD